MVDIVVLSPSKGDSQGYIDPTHKISFRLHQPLKVKLGDLEQLNLIQQMV